MKFEFEDYKGKTGFQRELRDLPICTIRDNGYVFFNKCAVLTFGIDSSKDIVWGITDDDLPCFKYCKVGRKITVQRKAYSTIARAAKFISDRFHGKFIIEEAESGVFILRKFDIE